MATDQNQRFLDELKFTVTAINQVFSLIEERIVAIEKRLGMNGPYLNALEIYDPATHIAIEYNNQKNESSRTESVQMSNGTKPQN